MLVRSQQAHMFALPMNIYQPASDLVQNLLRISAAIDARNRATGAKDIAAEDELSIFWLDIIFAQQRCESDTGIRALHIRVIAEGAGRDLGFGSLEERRASAYRSQHLYLFVPVLDGRKLLKRKYTLHAGTFTAGAHELRTDLATEQSVHGVDND